MSLDSLRRLAHRNDLEVAHLVKELRLGTPGLAEAVESMAIEFAWSEGMDLPDGPRLVPWARWARVVAAFARHGFDGLRPLVASGDDVPFVLGLVAELRNAGAVPFLRAAFADVLHEPGAHPDLAHELAQAVNLLLSFKDAVTVAPADAQALQAFLLRWLPLTDTEPRRAGAILALRGVGDESALKIVMAQADLPYPWQNTRAVTLRAIRKRLAAPRGPASNPA